jgi:hypothetical protein
VSSTGTKRQGSSDCRFDRSGDSSSGSGSRAPRRCSTATAAGRRPTGSARRCGSRIVELATTTFRRLQPGPPGRDPGRREGDRPLGQDDAADPAVPSGDPRRRGGRGPPGRRSRPCCASTTRAGSRPMRRPARRVAPSRCRRGPMAVPGPAPASSSRSGRPQPVGRSRRARLWPARGTTDAGYPARPSAPAGPARRHVAASRPAQRPALPSAARAAPGNRDPNHPWRRYPAVRPR